MTPIIAALLGASAAGYISHILTRRRERQKEEEEELRTKNQEHREKAGLLKLVHTEITNNLWYLKRIESDGDNPKVAEGLKSDAWEQSRIKLAELVESQQHFEYLVSCYGSLSVLKNRLLQPKTQNMTREAQDPQIQTALDHHRLANEVCRVETGLDRSWRSGMLVSIPDDRPSELEELRKGGDEEAP